MLLPSRSVIVMCLPPDDPIDVGINARLRGIVIDKHMHNDILHEVVKVLRADPGSNGSVTQPLERFL